ncbi:hypothetical protein BKA61DRAFT_682229 [Leptodontidium sp. MPI-SDFR-AT-0119]|nr:hypothetical protein BKA61DRAFT_682229 [Leptodontidium sp. MPI-SDFR-AT-0119]
MRAPIYILSALGLTNVVFGFSCIGQDPRLLGRKSVTPSISFGPGIASDF